MGVNTFSGLGSKMHEFVQGVEYELQARDAKIKKRVQIHDGVRIEAKTGIMNKSKSEIRAIGNDIQYTYGSGLNVGILSILCIFFFTLIAVLWYFVKKGSAEDIAQSAGQAAATRISQYSGQQQQPPQQGMNY